MTALDDALRHAVGAAHVLAGEPRYEDDVTGRFGGPAALVVRPASVEEVAAGLAACSAAPAALAGALRGTGLALGVDFGARNAATIGGMAATDAGGAQVLRHGTMRARVAGLEAVLADGTVLRRLSGLVKDNAGYDLPQLLVGSEGTLAVITAVRLALVPAPPRPP